MQMKDRQQTRIIQTSITSYAPDKSVNYAERISWPTIRLTIGSLLLVLDYDKLEDRDLDLHRLDEQTKGNMYDR